MELYQQIGIVNKSFDRYWRQMLKTGGPTTVHGYLVAVEFETDANINSQKVADKLAEGPWFMEGVGKVEVNYLGEIEEIDG